MNTRHTNPIATLFFSAVLFFYSLSGVAGIPEGAVYKNGGDSKVGIILLHGKRKNPKWKVVNPLRLGINKRLGYHTLSLQLPSQPSGTYDVSEYAKDFPEAYNRIIAGVTFLLDEKSVDRIYLIGHSMGSIMAIGFVSEHPEVKVNGVIGVGIRNSGPLPVIDTLEFFEIPVLDLYGDKETGRHSGEQSDIAHAKARSHLVSDRYEQVIVHGANHLFEYREEKLVDAAVNWLEKQ